MINKLILKPKYRNTFRVLAFIMLVAFSASLYSCQTTEIYEYTSEQLRADDDVKYIEVKTNNDSIINLSHFDIIYKENPKDSSNILLIKKTDTIFIKEQNPGAFKLKKSLCELNIRDIKNIKVEKTKLDFVKTSILVGGILTAIITFLIINNSYVGWDNTGNFSLTTGH